MPTVSLHFRITPIISQLSPYFHKQKCKVLIIVWQNVSRDNNLSQCNMYVNCTCSMPDHTIFLIASDTLIFYYSDEAEKRRIWMYESAALLALCGGIHAFHHTPYLLIVAAVATFLYTQLKGRVNFR